MFPAYASLLCFASIIRSFAGFAFGSGMYYRFINLPTWVALGEKVSRITAHKFFWYRMTGRSVAIGEIHLVLEHLILRSSRLYSEKVAQVSRKPQARFVHTVLHTAPVFCAPELVDFGIVRKVPHV